MVFARTLSNSCVFSSVWSCPFGGMGSSPHQGCGQHNCKDRHRDLNHHEDQKDPHSKRCEQRHAIARQDAHIHGNKERNDRERKILRGDVVADEHSGQRRCAETAIDVRPRARGPNYGGDRQQRDPDAAFLPDK
jgi:hypothetical protein